MSNPAQSVTCVFCGQSLPSAGDACPACHASVGWQNLVGAVEFAQKRFELWEKGGLIGKEHLMLITSSYLLYRKSLDLSFHEGRIPPTESQEIEMMRTDRCWSCGGMLAGALTHCSACGAPTDANLVQELHHWSYTCRVVKSLFDSHRLPLAQAHACINDAKGRIAVLRANLEKTRQPVLATAVEEDDSEEVTAEQTVAGSSASSYAKAAPASPPPKASSKPSEAAFGAPKAASFAEHLKKPRRPILEILLDPRSIQWLLGLGGALLVIGLVIWLATLKVFENKLVVAAVMGAANAAFLGAGWAITTRTRFQTAGRALTLLACLVMPLNLWFYHAQGLMTLDGNLWVAALVCCVLYAASAMVLRDPMFVYVFVGGIAMTGLLMLNTMGKFWEIAAPSILLAVLGIICIHVERVFSENEGPFSRRRFGLAFFWSGHAVLAAGLILLFGAQLAGDWLYKPFFESLYQNWKMAPPEIVTQHWGQLLSLALVVAGFYAYVYSDFVVRRVGLYIYFAVFTLLWAEVLIVNLFALAVTTEVAIIALALTALGAILISPTTIRVRKDAQTGKSGESLALAVRPLARAAMPLGLVLSTLPVVLGLLLFLRATYQPLHDSWPRHGTSGELYSIGWLYVVAMFLTAGVCRLGAHLYRHAIDWLTTTYFFGTGAATILGMAGLLSVFGLNSWDELAMALMVIPIFYAISARLYRGHSQEKPLMLAAQIATAVILVSVLAAWAHLTPKHVFEPQVGTNMNLTFAVIFAEAAVFYGLATAFRKQSSNIYLCAATACGTIWQLLQYWTVGPEYYTLIFALGGFFILLGYRFSLWERAKLAEPAFQSANALMSLSFVAAALLTASRLAVSLDVHWSLVGLLASLAVISLLAAWLVRHAAWRRWYVFMAIVEAGLMFLTMHMLSNLNTWEKMEIFSVVIGLALLTIGHIGWHREYEHQEDLVSFSLMIGSLMVAVPLAIAVLIHRSRPEFSTLNELGMFLAGMLMLSTGFIFQLRSTTITGATLLMIYVLTMLLYINMLQNVQTAAIWMTIGGGVIFGSGVLLSVYRDRLLTLPDQIKRREGIFRVLTWR